MTLTTTRELLDTAVRQRHGVAAFNVVLLEHAEAFVAAAETTELPVILQISENCVRYHGSLAPLGGAVLRLAQDASVPVAVHLDHAESLDLVLEAVDLGFTGVMYDGSGLDYPENVRRTAQVVATCHVHQVPVEAELGEIGGKDGVHRPGVRTDPEDAHSFVEATGVDALAVAVGSSHAMTSREAVLDEVLISALANAVAVPLVLHGSSGVPDEGLVSAVRAGITKVNIATHLNTVFTQSVRERLDVRGAVDPRDYVRHGRAAVAAEAARLLRVLNEPSGKPEQTLPPT
ncbi:fructose-bisphosphate aldolase [Amycolatopsis marina]|uniref:Fructose-bisphosphate aldolase n=1 Tax=Amycolatopsis marina TaxID=490629 RepID=A0A1I0WLQ3_9PSEU|nr:class II fructose-bisphosphate aldolase [Amycolatopsis marina]SFA89484.1 fructose-bisphosphate aldolase [Amycolatopsis marina]